MSFLDPRESPPEAAEDRGQRLWEMEQRRRPPPKLPVHEEDWADLPDEDGA